ncbi:ATP-dependent exoDNAse (exonuclease V) beta subunit (contains helicase and exonuclease domains) [Anaerobranca californiensis DSM 14826]|jgi:ATP-dependent exoDNAse (exonuclease V) beta subunit|uniref:DNA 3'-5' helicase n=1 Tax=Anaerobranca californiensis DSM 14826 TaxID=1120989 RepID=A0A1M6LHJ6_9FIRM|nr:UvrD-helicase domain-containing protein [Anaerobranca californiensis]SHJ70628.1 ATP-dependent exoDNAse (exonuclease V) beta subunit (contains helicase and exonuclease domains) [Anaerobranca californiensis DSM 14826]
MEFNPEQIKAIESEKRQVLISAGAGSGKTRVLTERFFYLCNKKLEEKITGKHNPIAAQVPEIVAITFTEKAAREMKTRIRKRIDKEIEKISLLPEGEEKGISLTFWQEQKEELDFSVITTFHSFCYKLLQNFALNAELPPDFPLLDQNESLLIKNRVFNELLEIESNFRKWKPLFTYFDKNSIKKAVIAIYEQIGENPEIDVVNLCNSISPHEILEIQDKSLTNIKERLIQNFYQRAGDCVKDLPNPNSVKGKLSEHIRNITNHFTQIDPANFSPDECYELLLQVMPRSANHKWQDSAPAMYELCNEHFKTLKESWKSYDISQINKDELITVIELFMDLLCAFGEKYNKRKEEGGVLDFADLQKKAIKLLEENQEIRKWCQKNYKHIMIDEFQDTNQLQMKMLEYINPQYRFIVGDSKQSIYRFRGADVTIMNTLLDDYKSDGDTEIIDMGRNYRNCDSIIGFVNELFQNLMVKDDSKDYSKYYINYNPLISNRQKDFEKLPNKKVEFLILNGEGEDTEYDLIAQRILELVNNGAEIVKETYITEDGKSEDRWRRANWKDIAILIPARTYLTVLERKLKERNIPYYVHGGVGFFQKEEVQDFLNILRFINRPWEELHILSLLRGPLFRMTLKDFFYLKNHIPQGQNLVNYILTEEFSRDKNLKSEVKEKLAKVYQIFIKYVPFSPQVNLKEALLEIFYDSGLKMALLLQPNSLQSIKNVEKLIDIIVGQNSFSLEQSLEQIEILASLGDKEGEGEAEIPEGNMVTIMTVHGSKGLEFPVVFLPNLNRSPQRDNGKIRYDEEFLLVLKYGEKEEENLTPGYKIVNQKEKIAAIEESKRLFYVAVTRARDYLVMTSHVKKENTNGDSDEIPSGENDSWHNMLKEGLKKNVNLKEYIYIKNFEEVPKSDGKELQKESITLNFDIEDRDILPTFSVSEVVTFMDDPVKYYDYYIVKIDPSFFAENTTKYSDDNVFGGMEFGTLVHRVCELYDGGYSEEESVDIVLEGVEDPTVSLGELKEELLNLLEKYKEIHSLEIGEHIASEWSFTTEVAGAYIVGEIDKIYLKEGVYHLLDLKTNIIKDIENMEGLIKRYLPQIYLYKIAFEREFGGKVENVSLFFLREGIKGLRTIGTDVKYGQKIEEAIKTMISLKKSGAGRDEYLKLYKEKN